MNILKKLTKKNLTLNKKRTIVTIIGIILSTSLIVCVAGMVSSFQKTLVEDSIKTDGYFHVMIKDMTKEDIIALSNNRDIKDYYLKNEVGYAKIDSKNDLKPYLYISAYNEKALNNTGLNLLEGRMPQNSSEIVISSHILDNGGLNYKIGDKLNLEVGNRLVSNLDENSILNQNNPLVTDEGDNNKSLEKFNYSETKSYTIVGIIKRPNYDIEPIYAPGYTAVTYKDSDSRNNDAFILYKNPKNYDEKTKNIANNKYDYNYNKSYLRWLGVSESETMHALYLVAIVVIFIIIISSVFVIKNSFAISITEKYKMYGMLRSIGATSKQIKRNVLYEGFVIGLIAIPIGIVCGIIAIITLVYLINLIIGDYLGVDFVYSLPLIPIIISIILSSLTIYLSTIFIAKKASKISAIEAIRSNQDIYINNRKIQAPKIIFKIFKIGGLISYKNLKRNKKKYRTTVVSIVVSIFVFLSLSSFLQFGFKMAGMYYVNMDYNMYFSANSIDGVNIEDLKTIASYDEVEHYSLIRMENLKIDKNFYSDYGKKIINFYGINEEDAEITVVALGEKEYDLFTKKIGVKDSNIGILIDEYKDTINKKNYVGNMYNFKNNDTLKCYSKKTNEEFKINIIRSNERPMGLERTYTMGGAFLIVSDEVFDKNFKDEYASLYVKAKNPKELEKKVITASKEDNNFKDINYTNYEESAKQERAMILIVSIFLYGFITVISLIGITNIFNTITTNMLLRSKEFATLKSIGMTTKEFNHMIRLESIFYGLKSLFIGIPLGLIASYIIYLAFKEGLEFTYIIPIKALIIVIIFVSIIIGITMKYSLSKINKQNIIETIRNENI